MSRVRPLSEKLPVRLSVLAKNFNRSERTLRDLCVKRKIPEAFRTLGGHWRVRLPLSSRTVACLSRRKFKVGQVTGETAPWEDDVFRLSDLFEEMEMSPEDERQVIAFPIQVSRYLRSGKLRELLLRTAMILLVKRGERLNLANAARVLGLSDRQSRKFTTNELRVAHQAAISTTSPYEAPDDGDEEKSNRKAKNPKRKVTELWDPARVQP